MGVHTEPSRFGFKSLTSDLVNEERIQNFHNALRPVEISCLPIR